MQARQAMNKVRALGACLGLLALTACGGGGDGGWAQATPSSTDPTQTVDPAVATDAAVATSYTASLADTPAALADTLEPVAVPDRLATDDQAEPI